MDNPTAEGTIDIDASPELVYELVTEVTALPEWAAETERCSWVGGATAAAVGARFRGHNRHQGRRWSTTCTVTSADPGRRFGFDVSVMGIRTARWEYEIEPAGGGSRVVESTRRLVPRLPANLTNRLLGVRDRDAHNQANIERTLARLKDYAESRAASR
jgi:uncharacterized protein YndB with AHSA1/START domain